MTQVKRYDIFDIRLQAKAGKPFDTPLKAHLAAPDGTRITVLGFYDGGDRLPVLRSFLLPAFAVVLCEVGCRQSLCRYQKLIISL